MIVIPQVEEILSQVIDDLNKLPLIVCGSRGSGKSSSVKTILKKALEDQRLIIKVFDPSGSWYWFAPLEYRQSVNLEDIKSDKIQNIGSCVFDIFQLDRETRREFFASIVALDFKERYDFMKSYGYKAVKSLPLILYILEECDTYLSSGVLRSKQLSSTIISDLVSIGRNYNMNILGISTRSQEIDTKLRERSNLLLGRQTGRNSLNAIRGATNLTVKKLSQKLPDYYFIYWRGSGSDPFRIPDTVDQTPKDYPLKVKIINHKPTQTESPKPEETESQEWTYGPIRGEPNLFWGLLKMSVFLILLITTYLNL